MGDSVERDSVADKAPERAEAPTPDNVRDDATPAVGDGARNFQQIANASQDMVRNGTLNDLPIDMTPGSAARGLGMESRPPGDASPVPAGSDVGSTDPRVREQSDRIAPLARTYELDPKNLDQFSAGVVSTFDSIKGAKTPEEASAAFKKGLTEFNKDNPSVEGTLFGRALEGQFQRDESTKGRYGVSFENTVGMLQDSTQSSPENPRGVIAMASLAEKDSPQFQRDQTAIANGDKLRQLDGGKLDLLPETPVGQAFDTVKSNGLTAPIEDLPPRERPESPQSREQQIAALRETGTRLPDNALAGSLLVAEQLAFNTAEKDMPKRIDSAMTLLRAANPDVPVGELSRLLTSSMNVVTQSKDFSSSSTYSGMADVNFFSDKRAATESNPHGTLTGIASPFNGKSEGVAEFQQAKAAATVLRDGAPAGQTREQHLKYVDDAYGALSLYRK